MFKISHSKRLQFLGGAAITIMFILTLWQVATWTEDISLTLLRNQANRDLERYVGSLQSKLAKFEALPRLLAAHDNLVQVLLYPKDSDQVDRANRYLETVQNITGASHIFVMDTTGLTLASANWNTNLSPIGNKYDFRPYFKQALRGELGRYFALGVSSEERSYFFAYQVRRNGDILGVVAVRINLSSMESQRAFEEDQFLVTDEDGVIFISTREQWIFKTLRPLSAAAIKKIKEDQRYPVEELIPLPVSSKRSVGEAAHMLTIRVPTSSGASSEEGGEIDYLMLETSMPEAEWKAHVLSNLASVRKQVLWASVLMGSIFVSLVLIALFLLERRKAIQSRLAGFEQMTGSIRHELVRSMSPIKSLANNLKATP